MSKPFFSSATRYPLTLKPITSPDVKPTHSDIFNIQNTIRSLLRDMDTLFLGQTLATAPENDDQWVDLGTGGTVLADGSEQSISADGAASGTNLILRVRPVTKTKITAAIHCQHSTKDHLGAGLAIRNAASGVITLLGTVGANVVVRTYSSPTVMVTEHVSVPLVAALPQWYRALNDGTNLHFQTCADGESWITLHSQTVSTYDQAGLWLSNENNSTPNLAIRARMFSFRDEPA